MKLFCVNGCEIDGRPFYKTREFHRQPDETSCPECGGYLQTGMEQRAKKKAQRRGGSISPASPEQRAKVRGAVSIISAEGPCHPAHVLDRRYGGCDSPDCVVPLTPREHRDYEENRLDILGALIAGGYWVELGHVITEHEVGPLRLVELTTGEGHHPQKVVDLKQARIVELEAHIHV